jgi:hypothetical protein
VLSAEQADILYELRDVSGVDGVYALAAGGPSTVVVLERSDPYVLAVVTCALIRAIPDRNRFHVGVSTATRFHQVFDVAPLALDDISQHHARARAEKRPPPPKVDVEAIIAARDLELELMWLFDSNTLYPIEVVPDPFRSLDPSMPIVVTRAVASRERRRAWQAETVSAALERLVWAKPRWIACDEDLAIGDDGLLEALGNKHPEMLERTMVIASEHSADWMRKLIARRFDTVRVVVREA